MVMVVVVWGWSRITVDFNARFEDPAITGLDEGWIINCTVSGRGGVLI